MKGTAARQISRMTILTFLIHRSLSLSNKALPSLFRSTAEVSQHMVIWTLQCLRMINRAEANELCLLYEQACRQCRSGLPCGNCHAQRKSSWSLHPILVEINRKLNLKQEGHACLHSQSDDSPEDARWHQRKSAMDLSSDNILKGETMLSSHSMCLRLPRRYHVKHGDVWVK